MRATITPNTNVIDATILAPVSKSFASGYTGLAPVNLTASAYVIGGGENPAVQAIGAGATVSVLNFSTALAGTKYGTMVAFLSVSGSGLIRYNLELWLNGALLTKATTEGFAALSWGIQIPSTPAGAAVAGELKVVNLGLNPFSVIRASAFIMEYN